LASPVIVDTDPGVDDALAIILAARSPELRLHAITAVSGNAHVDKTSINALRILEAIGETNIPVARGAAKPLRRELEAEPDFFGKDGLGNSNLPAPKPKFDQRNAPDLLVEEVGKSPGEITVLAVGPLTNIAQALMLDPAFARNVRQLVIMGGAYAVTPYGYGNINPVAEFNIWVDPEAADIVFKSGIPITAIGLDVTTDPSATIHRELYRKIEQSDTSTANLVRELTRQWINKFELIHLHDPMAAAYLIDPTLFTTKDYHVAVETVSQLTRGQTVADRRGWVPENQRRRPNAKICTAVDGPRFLKLFMQRLVGLEI